MDLKPLLDVTFTLRNAFFIYRSRVSTGLFIGGHNRQKSQTKFSSSFLVRQCQILSNIGKKY